MNKKILQDSLGKTYAKLLNIYYYPYYKKIGRNDLQILKKFEKYQFFDETEIYEWKFDKIKKLLWYCNQFVPYYKDIFKKEHIVVSNIKDIEDFQSKIPVITKSDILHNIERFKSTKESFPPIIKNATGGSTGQPLVFYQDRNELSYKEAMHLLNLKWSGWNLWEKRAFLWGSNRDIEKKKKKK